MSLLALLKLPTPKHFLPPGGTGSMPLPSPGGTTAKSTPTAPTGAKPVGGEAGEPRAEALKVRGEIEARRRQAADLLLRMQKVEPLLKAKVAAASGDEKKKLAEQQALLARKIADAEKSVTRAQADLDAIDNPGSKREELLAILARQRVAGKVAESTEISSPGLDPNKKSKINKDVTTTTTSYANGQAHTEKVREQQKVGLGGYTKTQSRDKEVTNGNTTVRAGEEKKTQVSLGGKVSQEEKKSVEVERADGSKAGIETSKAKELSTKGVSQTQTVKTTNFDGSSKAMTTKKGLEREDGKVIATKSSNVTTTSKSGTAISTDKNAGGGFVSGKDGTGVQGKVGGGKTVTTKKGLQAGVVGELHGNVTCKVGEPKGDPKRWPVTVTVSFGGSAGLSGGAGKKEGSKVSGSVEIKASEDRTMSVTHHFTEAEMGDYTKALQAASKGVVSGKHDELRIIAMGAKKNDWNAAREMWEGAADQAVSKKTADKLKNTGDSAQVSKTSSDGIAAKGNIGPVGGSYGVTNTHTKSTTVTRNDEGGLDVDAKQEHGREQTGSVSMQAGVVGLEVGKTHIHKTRFGYSISIDPKMDPDGKILEHLGHCKTEEHYNLFLTVHKGKVKVLGKSKGRTDAESTQIGVSIGNQKLELGTNQSVDKDVTVDAQGKVVSKKTVGRAGAGGKLGKRGDSVADEAVAETDAKGNTTVTLTTTTTKTKGDKEKKDLSGLGLSDADLIRLGGSAVRSLPFWNDQYRRTDEKQDWKKAGLAIVAGKGSASAVGHALAEFVGGDRVERMKTVMHLLRGGYKQTAGKAFEFPDSLRDIRDDYDLVIDDKLADKMNAYANKKGDPAAAKECQRLLAIVDRLFPRVNGCKDFKDGTIKTEMMGYLNNSRTVLNQAVLGFSGNLKPQDDPKVLGAEGDRLMKLCGAYGAEQAVLVDKLDDQSTGRVHERAEGRKLVRQLESLQTRWGSEYARLESNYAKRKLVLPVFPYHRQTPQIRPFEGLIAIYEKKFPS